MEQINPITNELLKGFPITTVVVEAMYWRKCNAIHKWFVDNVQKGIDDCGHYPVSQEDLKNLLNTINKVLKSKKLAPELLPPQSGFFFGSADLDQYYWEDLKDTKKKLTDLLSKFKDGDIGWDWSFEYHSSW